MKIDILDTTPDMLGESPLWDAQSQRLFWVDVVNSTVRALDPATGKEQAWTAPSHIGSIGLAPNDSLILALQDGFYRLHLPSSAIELIARLPTVDPRARLNDGKMDRQGRYICGSMGLHADPIGVLYRLTAPAALEPLADGIRISNAICFSPKGDRLYFADSMAQAIVVRDYDGDGTAVGEPRLFLDIKPLNSAPDGATVDSDGNLWVALVRTGQIARVAPDGKVAAIIDLPVDYPSCPAFGGANMDTLFVTSIRDSGTGRMVSKHENAGKVFALTGLGVTGLPETRFQD